MADLDELQATETVKITGVDPTGLETNPVCSSGNGELFTDDTTRATGTDTTVTLGAGASQEAKIGASAKTDRKYITLQPLDRSFRWGHTAGSQPYKIFKNQLIILPYGPNTPIYIKNEGASSGDIVVGEV